MGNRKPEDPEIGLVEAGLLLDTYGSLLTDRQHRYMSFHFEQDLSFSEIAREFNISRQAVHDSVKHALRSLRDYEEALGLVRRTHGLPAEPDATTGESQLLDRLDELRRRVEQDGAISRHKWIARELSALIALLQGRAWTEETHV